jgi:DNA polymerase III subunit gamma/tau
MHLAKIYRANSFDAIVGQKPVISFIKNSLFKNKMFPVYLFSGMRGTGKTSLARIFSAARLCKNYNLFLNDPHVTIPCHDCDSCKLAFALQHPDIIEIDAASNSGVETMRSLIDNATLLPAYGTCKFYIIDEAHMLSKSAFNASLKIMEEPPENVYFILATTEFQKIIPTIRSRSIFLHFDSINYDELTKYVLKITENEKIYIENDAIKQLLIISEGSIRDTLNNLDTLTMMFSRITLDDINNYFGIVSQQLIENFIDAVFNNNEEILEDIQKQITNNTKINKKFFYIVLIKKVHSLLIEKESLKNNTYDKKKIILLLEKIYMYENMFLTSLEPEGILSIIFYNYNTHVNTNNQTSTNKTIILENKHSPTNNIIEKNNFSEKIDSSNLIQLFVNTIMEKDKALGTIFKQGNLVFDKEHNKIVSFFKNTFIFYKDFVKDKQSIWQPLINEIFGNTVTFDLHFNNNNEHEQKQESASLFSQPATITSSDLLITEPPKNNQQNQNNNNFKNNNSLYNKGYYGKNNYKSPTVNKEIVNKEELGEETKKIIDLFPGTTYKKNNNE